MKLFQTLLIHFLIISISVFISCKTVNNIPDKKQPSNLVPKAYKSKKFLKLPKWFIEKPEISGINLCYAYGTTYYNKKEEKKYLLLSAAENIEKSKKLHITVIQSASHQTGKFIGQTDIKESDIEINEDCIEKDYAIVTQFKLEKGILALATERSQFMNIRRSGLISSTIIKMDIQKPPEWVNTPPDKKGYIFGVGIAQDHSTPQKAWLAAETNARADIAKQYNMKILNHGSDYQRQMWEWLRYNHQAMSSVLLKNVSIIKHGYCKTDRTYYALARMKDG